MDDEPSLDSLLEKEADAVEALSKAFIRLSLARADVHIRLRELRANHQPLFTGEWDFNEVAMRPPT